MNDMNTNFANKFIYHHLKMSPCERVSGLIELYNKGWVNWISNFIAIFGTANNITRDNTSGCYENEI